MRLRDVVELGGALDGFGGRYLEPAGAEAVLRLSPRYEGQSNNPNATANVKGTWYNNPTPLAAEAFGFILTMANTQANRDVLFDFAFGGAGAEVVKLANVLYSYIPAGNNMPQIVVPLYVPRGTTFSGRAQANVGSSTVDCRIFWIHDNPWNLVFRNAETWGANTADSGGTSVDPGAVANTKGAWVELTAATARRTRMMNVHIGNQGNSVRADTTTKLDIGVGAAGSEVVVLPDLHAYQSTLDDYMTPPLQGPFPVDIPAGSRIAARSSCGTTDATDRLMDVVVYGFSA